MDHNRSFSYETFHSVRGFSTAMFDCQRVDKILDDPGCDPTYWPWMIVIVIVSASDPWSDGNSEKRMGHCFTFLAITNSCRCTSVGKWWWSLRVTIVATMVVACLWPLKNNVGIDSSCIGSYWACKHTCQCFFFMDISLLGTYPTNKKQASAMYLGKLLSGEQWVQTVKTIMRFSWGHERSLIIG